MTSSDEELVIRPFEIVETELLCPNSNTEPEKTESVKNNAEPEKLESVKDNAVNSPVHDEILVVEDPKTAKKKKLVPVLEKLTKLAMKRKVEPVKTTKTPKKKVEKPPSEPKPEINIKPDENVKVLKGSTGEDAKNLIAGLKERGINLKERETIEKQEEEEATKVASKVEYETSVFIPKKENIGRCVTTINTPEEDLIFFDIRVFSDPIFFDGSNVQSNAAGIRDAKDDNLRLTKAYCMTTYDDATDAEIEKVMHVSPFECLFDYHQTPSRKPKVNKSKVKVLNHVVIEAKQKSSLASSSSSSSVLVKKEQESSNIGGHFANGDKKRKADDKEVVDVSDASKKMKIDHELLQNVDVNDFLQHMMYDA
ncbi:uncharacterized protein [Atheta coriaria]|uniref:uncharacterized protein n=1 Tax=Dalotia coriaria TaxID=877792 RepID=UPI0031F3D1F8